jgi:hypothetical protein
VQDLHGTDGIDATDSAHLLCLCLHGCVASKKTLAQYL